MTLSALCAESAPTDVTPAVSCDESRVCHPLTRSVSSDDARTFAQPVTRSVSCTEPTSVLFTRTGLSAESEHVHQEVQENVRSFTIEEEDEDGPVPRMRRKRYNVIRSPPLNPVNFVPLLLSSSIIASRVTDNFRNDIGIGLSPIDIVSMGNLSQVGNFTYVLVYFIHC